jgi:hypothetical protein
LLAPINAGDPTLCGTFSSTATQRLVRFSG